MYADESSFEVDRGPLEPDRLAHPEAGAVEELDERAVAKRARGRAVRRVDQSLDLAGRECPREGTPPARQVELCRGVVRARAEQHLMAEEGAERGDPPRDRRRRETVGAELRDVALELLRRRDPGGAVEPLREVCEVAAVRLDRARRQPRSREREESTSGVMRTAFGAWCQAPPVPGTARCSSFAGARCRRPCGGASRRRVNTSASSRASCGRAAPGSCGGRRRPRADASRTRAAAGAGAAPAVAACSCRAACPPRR